MALPAVSNNIAPGAPFPMSALSPATEYRLRVTAHNEAGSTRAEYLAATLDAHGGSRHGQVGLSTKPSQNAKTSVLIYFSETDSTDSLGGNICRARAPATWPRLRSSVTPQAHPTTLRWWC